MLKSTGSQRVRHDSVTEEDIGVTESLGCAPKTNNIVKQLHSNKK